MGQLQFDEETSRRIEAAYSSRDVLRRRALVREAVGARPGDRVLDVGCGPGFYVAEILEEVGPEGSVVGVDGSAAMLGLAADSKSGQPERRVRPGRCHLAPGR